MKKLILSICLLYCSLSLSAQHKIWVFFTDKGPQQEKTAVPTEDLPVYQPYVAQLKQLGLCIEMQSRWLNAAVVEADEGLVKNLKDLSCVKGLRTVRKMFASHRKAEHKQRKVLPDQAIIDPEAPFDYGMASLQNDLLNIQALHRKGMTGKGVKIAVLDAGFANAHRLTAFDSLWQTDRVLAFWDFVSGADSSLFRKSAHGTEVLSTIGANLPGKMVGTAPHASFILCRTEDSRSETRREEHNWVRALEYADSIGVDIIHSSLGYNEFDNPGESYTYGDMDGNTTIITKAADIAAKRGIIVTTSAGNSGNSSWRYLTAPCDGDSVLCVGAVNRNFQRAGFSSLGPTSDGRVKPDVVALGAQAIVASPNNRITYGDGTSFAAPMIAGLVACLRQGHPDRSNMDIIQAVRLSADQYAFPDAEYGYGIPDAAVADSLLTHVKDLESVQISMKAKPIRGPKPKIKPAPSTPVSSKFLTDSRTEVQMKAKKLTLSTEENGATFKRFRIRQGKQKVKLKSVDYDVMDTKIIIDTGNLPDGEYQLKVKTDRYIEIIKIRIDT